MLTLFVLPDTCYPLPTLQAEQTPIPKIPELEDENLTSGFTTAPAGWGFRDLPYGCARHGCPTTAPPPAQRPSLVLFVSAAALFGRWCLERGFLHGIYQQARKQQRHERRCTAHTPSSCSLAISLSPALLLSPPAHCLF